MPATYGTSRTSRGPRTELPLTPKVTSHRRGGHAPARRVVEQPQQETRAAGTPAMHLTPNVIVAARGGRDLARDLRVADRGTGGRSDLRGRRI